MSSVLRPAAALSAAALLAGTALALTAGPAAAAAAATDTIAPKVVSTSLLTDEIVVPASGWSDKVRFTVRATDNVGVEGVVVGVFHRGDLVKQSNGEPLIFGLNLKSGTARDGVWSSWIRQEAVDGVGAYTLRVVAFDKAQNSSDLTKVGTFVSRYNTKLAFEIADRTVAKGETLTLSGNLRRVGPAGWQSFAGQSLIVQFREAGTTAWKRVGRVYTGVAGTFTTEKFNATKPGSWRLVFAGDAKTVAVTSAARKVTIG